MDALIFNEISSVCAELLSANGFTCDTEKGIFGNDNAEFAVKYSDENKLFILEYTDKLNSAAPAVLSSWLFDGGSKNDATVIAEDFRDVIAAKLGIKLAASNISYAQSSVAMPTRSAAGEQYTIDSLTQKLLAVLPELKDEYKDHVAANCSYLYVDFLKNNAVPKIKTFLREKKNRKQAEKLFKSFAEIFYNCDRTASDALCAVIVVGVFSDGDPALSDFTEAVAEEYPYFVTACKEILKEYERNKKFKAVFEN